VPDTFANLDLYSPEELGNDYYAALIHGPQGSGKTTLAASVAELGPTLFIDLTGEKGTRSFRGSPWEANIKITRPDSITDLDDIFWALAFEDHPWEAVVLDSATSVQKMTMRYLLGHSETAVREIKKGAPPADIRTWGQSLDVMTDLATFWFGLADSQRDKPMHVIMTAQTKHMETDEGDVVRTPDVQKGAQSMFRAAPDYILYTDVMEEFNDLGETELAHIVRFGNNPAYSTKARLPYDLRGRIPAVLGKKEPLTLGRLAATLSVGVSS
jgi:hypothetical protein